MGSLSVQQFEYSTLTLSLIDRVDCNLFTLSHNVTEMMTF